LTCRTASEDPAQVDASKVAGARGWLCNTFPAYCTGIVAGGAYSTCNNVEQLSYAMTQYYNANGPDPSACSFGGIGQVVNNAPSTRTSQSPTSAPTSSQPTSQAPPSSSAPSVNCQAMWSTLTCRTASEDPAQVDASKVAGARSWLCNTFPAYCTGIVAGGAYSTCNSVEQLSYAMTQYYKANGPDPSACSFGGIGQVVTNNGGATTAPTTSATRAPTTSASPSTSANPPSSTSSQTSCQAMFSSLKCRTASENPAQVDAAGVTNARNWLCGTYPNYCTAIVAGGIYSSCNSVEQLSYAMSLYYAQYGPSQGATACDFGGVGHVYN